ncbi:VOC family protein [Streptomyces sp. NRRL F-5126]|uniref:VOC family protein n=1 Tax=Streptomyces sp. NRRL F-5126 TaxID=1463857 RepID=UPI0004C5F853|nr:VOC family protein [Streptomyces sp. NRRL F-5126]
MAITLTSLVLDAADLESESSFWHGLLGGTITRTPAHHFLAAGGLPVIVIQHAPEHTPPRWPEGAPQQVHFDLATDDITAADGRALASGGRRLRPAGGPGPDATGSRVYASPAGHPFCLRSA